VLVKACNSILIFNSLRSQPYLFLNIAEASTVICSICSLQSQQVIEKYEHRIQHAEASITAAVTTFVKDYDSHAVPLQSY